MGEIKRHTAITELDETALNRMINRILIGKPEKVDEVRTRADMRKQTDKREDPTTQVESRVSK